MFERSKGRTPNLFYFNPDAEDRIAAHLAGESYQPSTKVRSLITDLEILQVFLARQDDVILMQNPPSLEHLERLQDAGFQLPEIASISESMGINRQINQIQPWAAAPDLDKRFEAIDFKDPEVLWQKSWGGLFSKASLDQQFAEWGEHSHLVSDSDQFQNCLLYTSPSPRDRG